MGVYIRLVENYHPAFLPLTCIVLEKEKKSQALRKLLINKKLCGLLFVH